MQSIDKQPDYWQTRINASDLDCPDISGTFADSNELFLFDDVKGKVSFDLGGDPSYYPWQRHRCADCTVSIEWHGAGCIELSFSLYSPSAGQVDKLTLRRDRNDFDCKDGLLLIPFSTVEEIGIAGQFVRGTHAYSKAGDGSLIRREVFTQYWHTDLVIPGVTTAEHYTRWPAVTRTGSTKPSPSPLAEGSGASTNGVVYLYRRAKVNPAAVPINLDIVYRGSITRAIALENGAYVWYSAMPGTLTISTKSGSSVAAPVKAGEVTYVRATVGFFGGYSLEIVDAARAKKEVMECRLQRQETIPP
jgi:hypothetical protein